MGELTSYITAYDYVVPAARASIAKSLVKRHNMSEKEAAKLLGVTQAAVSKYVSSKYSDRIKEIEVRIDQDTLESYVLKAIEGKGEQVGKGICQVCQRVNPFDCKIRNTDGGE